MPKVSSWCVRAHKSAREARATVCRHVHCHWRISFIFFQRFSVFCLLLVSLELLFTAISLMTKLVYIVGLLLSCASLYECACVSEQDRAALMKDPTQYHAEVCLVCHWPIILRLKQD